MQEKKPNMYRQNTILSIFRIQVDLSVYNHVDYMTSKIFEVTKAHISFEWGRFRMMMCFEEVTSNSVLEM